MSFLDRLKRLLGDPGVSGADSAGDGNGPGNGTPEMITCMEAMERLHQYLDGELDEVSHEEVARHFALCKRCYPHLRLEERFRELLHRSGRDQGCPEHLRTQVLEVLAAEADDLER